MPPTAYIIQAKKFSTLLDLCVSSLRRGHANLLCIVPILTDDPRRESKCKGGAGQVCYVKRKAHNVRAKAYSVRGGAYNVGGWGGGGWGQSFAIRAFWASRTQNLVKHSKTLKKS